jgi:hypothetical protein
LIISTTTFETSLLGQLESTLLQTWIRAGKLRRWLGRSDCPPVIKECKRLFDKAYGSRSDADDGSGREILPEFKRASQHVPEDLKSLVKSSQVMLQPRFESCDNVMYSTQSVHQGNSLIYFYPNGNRSSSPIPGSIKYIFIQEGHKPTFAVRRQLPRLPEDGIVDPFSKYPYFPAKLYHSQLSDVLEEVKIDWVMCHYARWEMSSEHAVVLILSKVFL